VLADLSEVTIARLARGFDRPILDTGRTPSQQSEIAIEAGADATTHYDLWVDFMDMTDTRRLGPDAAMPVPGSSQQ